MNEAVSVVVVTHNRPELLRRALDAIVGQRYPGPIEVLVVFDRAEPDPAIASEDPHRRVRVMTNTHKPGLAGARNTGVEAAAGELIAFCDDDDAWLPAKLAEQSAALARRTDAIAAVCGIVIEYERRRAVRVPRAEDLTTTALLRRRVTAAHPSTVLVRRAALDAIGPVDEEIPGSYAEDYDWLLRCAESGPITVVELPMVSVRWGATSYFADRWQTMADAIEYLIAKHPEFATSPAGLGRLRGRQAFALAAAGNPARARALAREALSRSPREPRAHLAYLVSWGLLSPGWCMRVANARGRGI
ncbi:MAG: glycosyltransferase family 2 protein [Actinobacteria bacterium]|nr:glycosyltransferase family 2 protein [Actinomycetota bacterium]